MHRPQSNEVRPDPTTSRPDRERSRPTKLGHAVQDVARDQRFSVLSLGVSSTEPVANDRPVSEEGVLHPRLSMVAGFLLPSTASDLIHPPDRAVAKARPWSPPRHGRRDCWWNDDFGATYIRRLVDRDRVVGTVGSDARDVAADRIDELQTGRRVVGIAMGQRVRDDRPRSIDAQMKFLPAPTARVSMRRSRLRTAKMSRRLAGRARARTPANSRRGISFCTSGALASAFRDRARSAVTTARNRDSACRRSSICAPTPRVGSVDRPSCEPDPRVCATL